MKSDWLESYLVFSDLLNFTKAANQLHISQPALHVKMSKLSDYIGKPLYQKVGRNLVLTSAGEQLRGFALEQTHRSNSFLAQLRGSSANDTVSLIAGEGTYRHLISDALSQFMLHSGYKLKIYTGDANKIAKSVISGHANLGITPLTHSRDLLKYQKFYTAHQNVVMPAEHPLTRKKWISFKDLEKTSLVVPPEGKPHRELITRVLMDAG